MPNKYSALLSRVINNLIASKEIKQPDLAPETDWVEILMLTNARQLSNRERFLADQTSTVQMLVSGLPHEATLCQIWVIGANESLMRQCGVAVGGESLVGGQGSEVADFLDELCTDGRSERKEGPGTLAPLNGDCYAVRQGETSV